MKIWFGLFGSTNHDEDPSSNESTVQELIPQMQAKGVSVEFLLTLEQSIDEYKYKERKNLKNLLNWTANTIDEKTLSAFINHPAFIDKKIKTSDMSSQLAFYLYLVELIYKYDLNDLYTVTWALTDSLLTNHAIHWERDDFDTFLEKAKLPQNEPFCGYLYHYYNNPNNKRSIEQLKYDLQLAKHTVDRYDLSKMTEMLIKAFINGCKQPDDKNLIIALQNELIPWCVNNELPFIEIPLIKAVFDILGSAYLTQENMCKLANNDKDVFLTMVVDYLKYILVNNIPNKSKPELLEEYLSNYPEMRNKISKRDILEKFISDNPGQCEQLRAYAREIIFGSTIEVFNKDQYNNLYSAWLDLPMGMNDLIKHTHGMWEAMRAFYYKDSRYPIGLSKIAEDFFKLGHPDESAVSIEKYTGGIKAFARICVANNVRLEDFEGSLVNSGFRRHLASRLSHHDENSPYFEKYSQAEKAAEDFRKNILKEYEEMINHNENSPKGLTL